MTEPVRVRQMFEQTEDYSRDENIKKFLTPRNLYWT